MEKEVVGEVARGRDHDGGEGVGDWGRGVGRVERTRLGALGRGEEPHLPDLRDGVDHGAWGTARGIHDDRRREQTRRIRRIGFMCV